MNTRAAICFPNGIVLQACKSPSLVLAIVQATDEDLLRWEPCMANATEQIAAKIGEYYHELRRIPGESTYYLRGPDQETTGLVPEDVWLAAWRNIARHHQSLPEFLAYMEERPFVPEAVIDILRSALAERAVSA